MNPEWLCYVNGQEYGPYTWPQLVQMAAAGNVLPSTHVRRNFDSQWYTAEQVPGLFRRRLRRLPKRLLIQPSQCEPLRRVLPKRPRARVGPARWRLLLKLPRRNQRRLLKRSSNNHLRTRSNQPCRRDVLFPKRRRRLLRSRIPGRFRLLLLL